MIDYKTSLISLGIGGATYYFTRNTSISLGSVPISYLVINQMFHTDDHMHLPTIPVETTLTNVEFMKPQTGPLVQPDKPEEQPINTNPNPNHIAAIM